MNTTQLGIIALIKSSVTQQPCALPEGFSIEEALSEIKRCNVVPMCYDGAILCGLPRSNPAMQQLFRGYCAALMMSERQMHEVKRLFAAFDEKGIDYMPLKGCRMKSLYPKHELRFMRDVDVLIRVEQRQELESIMKELGYVREYDSDHEIIWNSSALCVELHKRLIPSYDKDFYTRIGDGWSYAVRTEGSCYRMNEEDEFVYLFTHFAKHYRNGGAGCRRLVDLWVYLRSHPEMDKSLICSELDKMKLLSYYYNIYNVIDTWFNGAPSNEKTEFISDFIFASGNFGTMENRAKYLGVISQKRDGKTPGSRLRYLLRVIFPRKEDLIDNYPVLRRHSWMLPLVWVYRFFLKLFTDRMAFSRQGKVVSSMRGNDLDEYEQIMRYVGLDFDF